MTLHIDPQSHHILITRKITPIASHPDLRFGGGATVQVWRDGRTYYVARVCGHVCQGVNVAKSRDEADRLVRSLL